jgi:hypothetical protein
MIVELRNVPLTWKYDQNDVEDKFWVIRLASDIGDFQNM